MPRKPWVPLPEEADLFTEVYIDESSQQHTRLVYGGLVVPMSHSAQFEAAIIAARGPFKPTAADGTPQVMKWQKVRDFSLPAYKRVVDTFLSFLRTLPRHKDLNIHCLTVDTGQKALHDRKHSEGDPDLGMDKDVYHLCVRVIARKYPTALFHVYPDRRTTNLPRHQVLKIMNAGARKHGDTRNYPFRRLRWADPETSQALQVVDIFIGALAYRLNRHYEQPEPNPAKKELCDYIMRKLHIFDPFKSTPFQKRFTIFHREYRH
jgi:hypothetical protein